MSLNNYKAVFMTATAILALLTASPALQEVLVYPQTEFFTEFWLLGPQHTAENYPYAITSNGEYTVFLGVANHLGSCAYYVIEVKFRNQTQSAPNSFNRTHSSLGSLYTLNFFVPEKETWEMPLTFSLDYSLEEVTRTIYKNVTFISPDGNVTYSQIPESIVLISRVNINSLRLNDATANLQGLSSDFDNSTNLFFGNLFFELWIYDTPTGNYTYHQRCMDLKFNMTTT